ncbi:MAG: penicillin-binding protein 1A [Proteobacteria bacterium]|nr:penicillin-binding protein 1A [Pseudomonadota bacterium]
MKKVIKVLWFFTKLGLFFAVLGVVMIFALYKYYEPQLPSVDTIRDYKLQIPLRVFSGDGKLISVFGTKRRVPVEIEDIPEQVKQAYLAAEDANFYNHHGFDVKGILRAVWQIVTTGEKQGGGSTITQQLTRNVFLTLDQTWARKIKELFLAVKIERTISKDDILELYLNKIPLGHRAYGVAAAADVYYGKKLSELTLAEAAMLAAPPKAPSRINPVTSPERALLRRDYVLARMLDLEFIDEAAYNQAIAEKDKAFIHQPAIELSAPWIAEMVRARMIDKYGDAAYTDGYAVVTTIDSNMQQAAEKAVRKGLHAYDKRHGYRGTIQHFDIAADADIEVLTKKLTSFPKLGGLQAALVIEVEDEFAIVRLDDGQDVSISMESSSWAAPYIDNERVGNRPKVMHDVVSVGDIIMVKRNDSGDFELTHIPQVQAALVSINPNNGHLNALIGGYDYYLSKYNRATQARRQPGSGFKPIIYSAALDHGLNAASMINDAPIVFDDDKLERAWRPKNYSKKFFGPTRLREGIVKSRNLVSIRVLRRIGLKNGRDHIVKFGFNSDHIPKNDLSIALGSPNVPIVDMSRAFSIFANGGYLIEPVLIKSIRNQSGDLVYLDNSVQVCPECEPVENNSTDKETFMSNLKNSSDDVVVGEQTVNPAPRIISAENQFIIESFMKDVIIRGTGTKAKSLNRADLAGKTGTTNDQRDAWFNGYQRNNVTNVWVGFDTPDTLGRGEVGGRVALPIWIDFMEVALKNEPEWKRPAPPGIISAYIDRNNGLLKKPNTANSIREYFIVGQLPTEESSGEEKKDYDDLF